MMQKHFRKKPPAGDEAGANGDNGCIASRSAPQKMALSFDPDEEGPTVKIKKKKKRSHALPPASNGPLPVAPAPSTGTSGTYSVGFLQKLRASQDMLRRSYDPECWESSARRRHSAAATEMYNLDYEKTTRPETSPLRRRPHSSRPLPRSAPADGEDGEGGLGMEALRESLSSRASKRLAEAIEFSATQSPASPLSQHEDDDQVLYDSLHEDDEDS